MERILVLEDGTWFRGEAAGSDHFRIGSLIFNTAMTGYQEIITDNANAGSMVVMTYPLIGAYGINRDDSESLKPVLAGLIVREISDTPSNFRSAETLESYMKRMDIPGIKHVDTRAIVRHLRTHGTMRATFCSRETEIEGTIAAIKAYVPAEHPVKTVSARSIYTIPGRGRKVLMIDYGVSLSMLRHCAEREYDLIVAPYDIKAETVLDYHPEGILLSGGPGNPAFLFSQIEAIRKLIGTLPVYGYGLGCELLGLACGADLEALPHGHHGPNQAVVDVRADRVLITRQNHQYALKAKSLEAAGLNLTFRSLNDGSVEGIEHSEYGCAGIEFDPDEQFFTAFEKAMDKEGH